MKAVVEIRRPARLESLTPVLEALAAAAAARGFAQQRVSLLELAVEEAVVNICRHSYPAGEGEFEARLFADGDGLIIEIVDAGIPFDPTLLPDPDIHEDLSRRQPGGLGVYFIKRVAHDVTYRHEGTSNILRFGMTRD